MARPVVVVVDDEDASRQVLVRELEGRYAANYRIVTVGGRGFLLMPGAHL